jgi:hypothetical protein
MVAWTRVALSASPLRRLSTALLTSATSGSEVCGIFACASGTAGCWGGPVPPPRGPAAAPLAGGEAPDESGRTPGRGTAVVVVLLDADFLSLDLADAAFFAPALAALVATFPVPADELLVPP